MEQIKKKNLSLILLLILGLIWGSSFLFIKLSVDTISPITAVLLRMSVATICIIFYLIYIKKKYLSKI